MMPSNLLSNEDSEKIAKWLSEKKITLRTKNIPVSSTGMFFVMNFLIYGRQ